MRESDFQRRVMQFLKQFMRNEPAFFWKASDRFRAGIPDTMGCYAGHMCGMELKVGDNQPTKLQRVTIEALRNAGATILVCRTMEEVEEFIETIMKRGDVFNAVPRV